MLLSMHCLPPQMYNIEQVLKKSKTKISLNVSMRLSCSVSPPPPPHTSHTPPPPHTSHTPTPPHFPSSPHNPFAPGIDGDDTAIDKYRKQGQDDIPSLHSCTRPSQALLTPP
ncbi:hypothetical protein BDR05DRAFT_994991 [Suillus weaverae]|nr:hypothetical protein BDR05DRAFT_994991 [Suillus weaverae]